MLDGLSTVWAEQTLDLYQSVPVMGQFVRLRLGHNTDMAFGLFATGTSWVTVVTGTVLLVLVVWTVKALRTSELAPAAGWSIRLLLGGALANFADRVMDGRVTDFLDFGFGVVRRPTFNRADSFIVLGIGLLPGASLFQQGSHESELESAQAALVHSRKE